MSDSLERYKTSKVFHSFFYHLRNLPLIFLSDLSPIYYPSTGIYTFLPDPTEFSLSFSTFWNTLPSYPTPFPLFC